MLRRVTTGPSGGNAPVDITCRIPRGYCGGFTAISEDGSRIFFDTQERLVPADTDATIDVYQRLPAASPRSCRPRARGTRSTRT